MYRLSRRSPSIPPATTVVLGSFGPFAARGAPVPDRVSARKGFLWDETFSGGDRVRSSAAIGPAGGTGHAAFRQSGIGWLVPGAVDGRQTLPWIRDGCVHLPGGED